MKERRQTLFFKTLDPMNEPAGEGDGDEFKPEMEWFDRKEKWSKAKISREDPVHLDSSNSNTSSFMEMGCRGKKMRRREKSEQKKAARERTRKLFEGTSQSRDPKTLERNSQEGSPSTPSSKHQSGEKGKECM